MRWNPRSARRLALAVFVASAFLLPQIAAASSVAYSDFGPGNTYGVFGNTVGGQFTVGYQFNSLATGSLSEIDIGIGGSGTFDLALYSDNAGLLGASLWSMTNIPVGTGSPNPAVISNIGGPSLTQGQNYWLVASGQFANAFWSPNTIGATGRQYSTAFSPPFDYQNNVTTGAFSVQVVPEPATLGLLAAGMLGLLVAARGRSR